VVTRRKYRQPQGFRDGGAVPVVDNIIIADTMPVPAEPAPAVHVHEHAPSPPPADDNPLVRAYAAHRRAEELQREAARQAPTIEQHIDAIPGLSSHKRQFLKAHPKMATDPAEARAMSFHYNAALNAGVQDDSPEMDRFILAGMFREREHEAKTAPPPAEAARPTPAAMPRKSSLPMSAPVSRDVPSYSSGKPVSNKMTLSPAEVAIARASFVDRPDMPRMSNAQKEYIYAQNKRRYLQMKADGSYSEQRGSVPVLRAGYRDDDR
jgi:hypothetical protein